MIKCNILILVSFILGSCSNDDSEVFADIKSYGHQILHKTLSPVRIIDRGASCAGKTTSYLVECTDSSLFKWDKSSNFIEGGYVTRV